ncbi:hypothetical protein, partial [Alkalibacillus haloalkaliphilus]|uniref:hypothetical protein n=1 Tax=Alkalibacillus haloalkaliphilus TaxID=94136 RepID=UPI0029370159
MFPANDWGDHAEDVEFRSIKGSLPEEEEDLVFPATDWGDHLDDAESGSITAIVSGNPASPTLAAASSPVFPTDDAGEV